MEKAKLPFPVIVSCPGFYAASGQGTGGLVATDGITQVIIDYLDTMGLFVYGGSVYRYVRPLRSLVRYDDSGLGQTFHLERITDGHDLWVDEGGFTLVSTSTNKIECYDYDLNLQQEYAFGDDGDGWHINSIYKDPNGGTCFSAFGEFTGSRVWDKSKHAGSGFIRDLETGEDLWKGLNKPHHPRRNKDGIWVCNSGENEILRMGHQGNVHSVPCGGFTRGFLLTDDLFLVGISADRKKAGKKKQAKVLVGSTSNMTVTHSINIPFPEIYDIIQCPLPIWNSIQQNVDDFRKPLYSLETIEMLQLKYQNSLIDFYDLQRKYTTLSSNRVVKTYMNVRQRFSRGR